MKGVSLIYELKSEAGQDRSAGLLAKATQVFCPELRMKSFLKNTHKKDLVIQLHLLF